MKKLLLTISAIAALTACSKSHIEYDEPAEIALAPVAQNITKSMVTGTTFPAEMFNLWAYYKPIKNATIAQWQANNGTQQTYITNKPFVPKGDGTWAGFEASYYWPKDGSLMFAGYYPTTLPNVSYVFNSLENYMTIPEYTPGMVTTETSHTEDVMYFNMTPTSKMSGPVEVTFRHALSWINVVLAKSNTTPDNAKITVNSVQFTDVFKTGTGVVNNSPEENESNEIEWTTKEGSEDDIEVCPEAVVISKGNTYPLAKQPLVIPQAISGNLVVNYTITSTDGSAFTETKTITLNTLSGTEGSETSTINIWKPAKRYTYTITIGTSEILIQPTVEEWKDVSVNPTI